MSRYRFALRPRWILSHLFVAALVVAMLLACRWQIHRLHEKQDRNARVRERTVAPTVPVEDLVAPGDTDVAGLEYRTVTATGTYRADQEVIVRSRSLDGAPGSWVLTPLLLDDGDEVVVNRGWIANSGALHAVPAAVAAPEGEVTVTGLVRLAETRGRFGATDPSTGTLTDLARADVARLDQQVPEDLLPVYVQLLDQRPAVGDDDPEPLGMPELDEGPHLSYAIQWVIFSTVAVVGYPLILRRRAREIGRGDDEVADGGPPDDGPDVVPPREPAVDAAPPST